LGRRLSIGSGRYRENVLQQNQRKVDFDGNVSARVEAEPMRQIPGIGRVISTVFWPVTKLLKYSVSGTLSDPKLEPLNPISRILTLPLMPLKALNELLTPDKKNPEPEK
jgi:hypothetical protein